MFEELSRSGSAVEHDGKGGFTLFLQLQREDQEKLKKLGMVRSPSSSKELLDLYRVDAARWAKLIKEANIKPQ